MDYLQEAKSNAVVAYTSEMSAPEWAAIAQVNTLIAICERLDRIIERFDRITGEYEYDGEPYYTLHVDAAVERINP